MPHLHIDYSANLDTQADIGLLCQDLAEALAALRDGLGAPMFPLAGTRVLAYPAPHHAVAGGREGFGFMYLNLRVTPGRSDAAHAQAGEALMAVLRAAFPGDEPVGITLQIDATAPAWEGKQNNIAAKLAQAT